MSSSLQDLLQTIHILRSPGGCPWDHRQTLTSAAHHLLDEAAELLEATHEGDGGHAAEELADLLFMVCFCIEILHEEHPVDFAEIARLGNAKLVRRHPHVFGDRRAEDTAESQQRWNEVKAAERLERGLPAEHESLLKDLPAAAAPLHQARQYQKDAAEVGFDWPDLAGVWDKVREEMAELTQASAGGDPAAVEHEVGDLLFAVVNLARRLEIRPDVALRKANRRFRRRFRRLESRFGGSRERLRQASLEELESAWQAAKAEERSAQAEQDGG